MDSAPRIEKLTDITTVTALAKLANQEGFTFLDRLIDEWNDGTNRFKKPGEAIFGAWIDDQLVGTAGLTVQREDVARVRRVYVHSDHRRNGIATLLMDDVLTQAKQHFTTAVLFTNTERAAAFYERLGFQPESPDGTDRVTHRLLLSEG